MWPGARAGEVGPGAAVAALRARQWAHFALLPAAALDPAGAPLGAGRLAAGVAVAALALAYAYGLNSIADRGTDRDAAKNPLAGLRAFPAPAAALTVLAGAGAAGLAAALGARSLAAAAIALGAATVYSVGPRMKATPVLGTALNAAIFAPLLAVALRAGPAPAAFPGLLAAFVALLLQNQLLHERADRAEDAGAGAHTTGRLLGERGTAFAVLALGLAGAALAAALLPGRGAPALACVALAGASLAGFPAGVPAAVRRRRHSAVAFAGGAAVFLAGWAP